MGKDEKIPHLLEARILCPECGKIQSVETEHKGDLQFINCIECDCRWEVFFELREERPGSIRGTVINEKTMPTKEPVPLGNKRGKGKFPGFDEEDPFGPGGSGGGFGSGGSGGPTGF